LLIFKEPCPACFALLSPHFASNKSFCLSAAEKRDYAAVFVSRQLLCLFYFLNKHFIFAPACTTRTTSFLHGSTHLPSRFTARLATGGEL